MRLIHNAYANAVNLVWHFKNHSTKVSSEEMFKMIFIYYVLGMLHGLWSLSLIVIKFF